MLILLDGYVSVRSVDIDIEYEIVVHIIGEFAGGNLVYRFVDGTLFIIHCFKHKLLLIILKVSRFIIFIVIVPI